jgi:hypothetical protein
MGLLSVGGIGLLVLLSPAKVVYNPNNGHYYEAVSVPEGIQWMQAKQAARERKYRGLPGHLVTITSRSEQRFVVDHLPVAVANDYWIGGLQDRTLPGYKEPGGGWGWITDEPWKFTAWKPGQPDESGDGNEQYLHFWGGEGDWNDAPNSYNLKGYVVEYEKPKRLPRPKRR